jgi:D-alanyl-D-alanine carboxypeptidase/D-alanyl-D-alanine-endopeptidase (penicillin-binding protein 4)
VKKYLSYFLVLATSIVFGQIDVDFESFKNSTALQGAGIGVSIVDIKTGNAIFESNGYQFFYPASLQKVITTSVALQLLGSDFKYQTKISTKGLVENGVLRGDVYIFGSGDPTTNSKHFSNDLLIQTLTKLKEKGIHTIEGAVYFKEKAVHNTPQTWLFEDLGNYYGAAAQIFNYKENMFTLSFQQVANGQTPSIKKIDLAVPYKYDLQLTCSSEKKGDHSFILGVPFSLERQIVGTITSGTGTFKIKGSNAHPQYTFKEELAKLIKIEGKAKVLSQEEILGVISSSDLKSICKITNHESINLFAEGILNTLGLTFQGTYSTDAGIEIIENYIKQSRSDAKEIIIKDGSGLSRLNALTPNFMAKWMCTFYENKDFVNSLAISGETGTMQYLNQPGIKGKVRGKSGSAEGVVNYAGYLTKNNGQMLAFSIFVNNAYQSRYSVRREIGVFLESLVIN